MMEAVRFHVLTLFPEMIVQGLAPGIIGRAAEKKLISLNAVNIRDYTLDRHGKVDDYPYGGGAGMLMQAQPVYDAYRAVAGERNVRTIYVTPQGTPFTQKMAEELAEERELVFLCGHYEGIDERALEKIVTDHVSIGDYVLTGGELPAMVMIDAIARLIPGVLGNDASAEEESFCNDLLEYPQYSRPEVWQGERVPEVLLSGDHSRITSWRLERSKERTAARRPDLYEKYLHRQEWIRRFSREKRERIHMMEGLARGRAEILYEDGENVLLYDRKARHCMINATDVDKMEGLTEWIPEEAVTVTANQPLCRSGFIGQYFGEPCERIQLLYTRRETLPLKYKNIRSLEPFEAAKLCGAEGGKMRELYGAFSEEEPAGMIGIQRDGSLCFFPEKDCARETAESLAAYAVNRLLEKGWTPYAQVPADREDIARLLEGLGFYRAKKTLWRLEKKLANEI